MKLKDAINIMESHLAYQDNWGAVSDAWEIIKKNIPEYKLCEDSQFICDICSHRGCTKHSPEVTSCVHFEK